MPQAFLSVISPIGEISCGEYGWMAEAEIRGVWVKRPGWRPDAMREPQWAQMFSPTDGSIVVT